MKTPVDFLQWLRPGGPWSLSAIVPDGKMTTRIFTDPDKAAKWVAERDGRENLYYAVNPLRPEYKADKKAGKTDVAALAFLHVDVDHLGEDHLARLREHDPSVIIMSGGGYNALWRLAEPVPISDEWPVERLELYNKHLENLLSADACHNIDRILRLPFTVNLPNKKKRERGRVEVTSGIVEIGGQTHPLSAFQLSEDGLREQSEPRPVVFPIPLPEAIPEVDLGDLPVDMRWKIIIRRGYDPGDPDLWPSRSEATFAATCVMVRAGVDDPMIGAVLLDPDLGISEHCLAQPKPREYAARQIARAKERVHG